MEKLAICGGTFNPIHNGHLHIAKGFCERLGFDRLLLMPASVPPHKLAPHLASAQHRLAMCQLAAESAGFEASDLELRRSGPSYTVDTLQELHGIYPNAELYLIMGADMFLTLEQWYDFATIFQLAKLCVAPRDDQNKQALLRHAKHLKNLGAKSFVEDLPLLPVSSTMIRDRRKQGLSIQGLVPEPVNEYILTHDLYGGVFDDTI